MFYQCGTVFQTAFLTTCYNPETSSRVTLASLGIGFQPNLMVVGHLWIKHQYKKNREKYICLFLFIDIFSSALYVIDFERGERAKGEWAHQWGTVFQTALPSLFVIPRLRPGLLSLCSVLASSQSLQTGLLLGKNKLSIEKNSFVV